jgi:hypothetical protein
MSGRKSVDKGKAPRVLAALEEADANGEALMPVVLFRRDGDGRWWGAMPARALLTLLATVQGFKVGP